MSRLGLLVFLVVSFVAATSFAEELDRESVAARQDAATLRPELAGVTGYVAEVTDTRWVADEQLRLARLRFSSREHRYALIGVGSEQRDAALRTMIQSHGEFQREFGNAMFRVATIPEGFDVHLAKDGDGIVVTARRAEIEPGTRAGLLIAMTLTLDARGVLSRAEFELHEVASIIFEDYAWTKCGERHRLDGVTVRRPESQEFERVAIDWVQLNGFWLPRRIERIVVRGEERREFLNEWRIHYRSVNGEDVAPQSDPAFSTPDSTVQAFLDGAKDGDRGLLAKCFSEQAPGEFQPIVKAELTGEQLEELKAAFGGARIVYVEREQNPDRAIVHIIYRRGGGEAKEQLEMVREPGHGEWKILDF